MSLFGWLYPLSIIITSLHSLILLLHRVFKTGTDCYFIVIVRRPAPHFHPIPIPSPSPIPIYIPVHTIPISIHHIFPPFPKSVAGCRLYISDIRAYIQRDALVGSWFSGKEAEYNPAAPRISETKCPSSVPYEDNKKNTLAH